MVYLATFTIKTNQMQVNLPYMDPMGLLQLHVSFQKQKNQQIRLDWLPELIRNHPLGWFGSPIWSTSTNQPCPKKGLPLRSLIYHLKKSLPNKKVVFQPHHFSEAMSNLGGLLGYAAHQSMTLDHISAIKFLTSLPLMFFFGSFSCIKIENTYLPVFLGRNFGMSRSLFFHGYRDGFQPLKRCLCFYLQS